MPYKVFVAGEEALASDANSYLMSQTVPRFTNATQRTSQLTAPVLNQLSIRDDNPGVMERWNGSAWVALPLGAERSVFLNPASIVNSGTEFTLASFSMPWAGVILVSGMARCDAGAGATSQPINCIIEVGPTSTPSWANSAQWLGPTQAANNYYLTCPFAFKTVAVAAGAACTIKVLLKSNVPAMGYQVTWLQASIRLIPAEF